MVRILANGDIVPDDDPRVKGSTTSNNQRQRNVPPQRGSIPPAADNQQYQGGVQQVSIFQTINQRLLAFGIPRWNIGDTVIEPIVSVGLLLAVMLFGIPGLLFGALLFAVSQWSTNGPPDFVAGLLGNRQQQGSTDNPGRGGTTTNRRGGGGSGGGGHRLGRD